MKKCEDVSHSCPFIYHYHCVMNAWRNESVEVCAPCLNIIGRVCPEYNFGGQRIQRSEEHCGDCPVSYNSTESYKYQECYRHSKPPNKTTELQPSTINNHTTVIRLNTSPKPLVKESHTESYTSVDASTYGKSGNVSSLTSSAKQQNNLGFVSVVVMCSMLAIILFTVLLYIKRSEISSCIKNAGSSVYESSTENLLPVEGSQIYSGRSIAAKIQV